MECGWYFQSELLELVCLDDNNVFLNCSSPPEQDAGCGLCCVCHRYTVVPVSWGWLQVLAVLALQSRRAVGRV